MILEDDGTIRPKVYLKEGFKVGNRAVSETSTPSIMIEG